MKIYSHGRKVVFMTLFIFRINFYLCDALQAERDMKRKELNIYVVLCMYVCIGSDILWMEFYDWAFFFLSPKAFKRKWKYHHERNTNNFMYKYHREMRRKKNVDKCLYKFTLETTFHIITSTTITKYILKKKKERLSTYSFPSVFYLEVFLHHQQHENILMCGEEWKERERDRFLSHNVSFMFYLSSITENGKICCCCCWSTMHLLW